LDLPQKIDDTTFIAQEPLAAAKPHPIETVQNTKDNWFRSTASVPYSSVRGEVLCGINCMEGPTPSATVFNQTMVLPPALTELIPGIPTQ